MEYLEPRYFFVSLFIGMLVAYIITPAPEIIIKYPTPHNVGKIVYKDSADVCYKYVSSEVNCPSDTKDLQNMIIQHVDIDKKNDDGVFDNLLKWYKYKQNQKKNEQQKLYDDY